MAKLDPNLVPPTHAHLRLQPSYCGKCPKAHGWFLCWRWRDGNGLHSKYVKKSEWPANWRELVGYGQESDYAAARHKTDGSEIIPTEGKLGNVAVMISTTTNVEILKVKAKLIERWNRNVERYEALDYLAGEYASYLNQTHLDEGRMTWITPYAEGDPATVETTIPRSVYVKILTIKAHLITSYERDFLDNEVIQELIRVFNTKASKKKLAGESIGRR